MFDARRVAAAGGVSVAVCDLGDWDALRIVAEYDARARAIRVNERALAAFRAVSGSDEAASAAFIDLAVAHELYHHREALGAVARLANRARREAAADAYARANVVVDPRVAAFLAAAPSPSGVARAAR